MEMRSSVLMQVNGLGGKFYQRVLLCEWQRYACDVDVVAVPDRDAQGHGNVGRRAIQRLDMIAVWTDAVFYALYIACCCTLTDITLCCEEISGQESEAICTSSSVLALEAIATRSMYTDPDATVAWTDDPQLKVSFAL